MVIKGVKHLAEITSMFDLASGEERFRYELRRENSVKVLYWGHEYTEEAAVEMANMYLNLLDDFVLESKGKLGPRAERVQFIAAPGTMRA